MPPTHPIDKCRLVHLKAHDAKTDDSLVRELEMAVDMAFTSPGYAIQFWQDVQLYGIWEAILYVKNGKHGNAATIQAEWDRIKIRIEGKPQD